MPRRHPDRGRRRKGRRPPHRHEGGPRPPKPSGFTGPGFDQLHSRLLPGLSGAEKRRHFNEVSGGIILAGGLSGLVLGAACFGPVLGLGAGLAMGGSFAAKGRFSRG